MIVIAVGGAGAAALAAATHDPLLAHDPGNSAATDLHSAGLRFDPEARASVGMSAASVKSEDLLGKRLVLLDAATGAVIAPRLETAAGNPESHAELGFGIVGLHRFDALEALVLGSERMPSVF